MSRIYDALQRADARRSDLGSRQEASEPVPADLSRPEISEEIAALAADLKRLQRRLEGELGEIKQESIEQFASLEISIGALEDRFDDERGESSQTEFPAELREQISQLQVLAHALEDRIATELPTLRAELDETIDKRVLSAASQWVGRDQATRDRLEARIDALRRDLDRGQRRNTILIGAVLLTTFLVYAC